MICFNAMHECAQQTELS